LDDAFVRDTIGFLYQCYKQKNPWLFLIFIGRRVIISGIVAMVNDRIWVNFSAILVLLVFLGVILYVRPFNQVEANRVQIAESVILIFTFTCLETTALNTTLFAFVVLINCALIIVLLAHYADVRVGTLETLYFQKRLSQDSNAFSRRSINLRSSLLDEQQCESTTVESDNVSVASEVKSEKNPETEKEIEMEKM